MKLLCKNIVVGIILCENIYRISFKRSLIESGLSKLLTKIYVSFMASLIHAPFFRGVEVIFNR